MPTSLEVFDSFGFYSCPSLEVITFEPNSELFRLGQSAFWLALIKKLVAPRSVRELQGCCFRNTQPLTVVTFDEELQLATIGRMAFCETGAAEVAAGVRHQLLQKL
jgi:hypothetical protein